MGTYLSKPMTRKRSHGGVSKYDELVWGSTEMQGWRMQMEDAYLAAPDFEEPSKLRTRNAVGKKRLALFAVFDGHGGRCVSRYAAKYMPLEMRLAIGHDRKLASAMPRAFLNIDRRIRSDEARKELNEEERRGEQAEEDMFNASDNDDNDNDDDGDDTDKSSNVNDGEDLKKKMELFNAIIQSASLSNMANGRDNDAEDKDYEETEEEEEEEEEDGDADGADVQEDGSLYSGDTDVAASSEADDTSSSKDRKGDNDVEEDEEDEDDDITEHAAHPAWNCGCTAVVAVVNFTDQKLIVANAGDSRCVLSRSGTAVPMSQDHKPTDEEELARIHKAGGCVTEEGRVDGCLNLSRSLGDFKFKQNSSLPASEQRITAMPDIREVKLTSDDDFFIIACDGIWEIMSSQDATDFVRKRLESTKREDVDASFLSKVAEDLCDECMSHDPDETRCYGCDNMTVVIVLLRNSSGTPDGRSDESRGTTASPSNIDRKRPLRSYLLRPRKLPRPSNPTD
eukprot:g2940.t1